MELRIWDLNKAVDDKHEEMDFVAHYPLEMYKDLDKEVKGVSPFPSFSFQS
ncbi:hypothetical protein H7992_04950 [Sporosarcina sp. resist]|uniref:hypothetical protein n=1 Tax=Sporosarcina sp. resist TaxID=2762563 RepID=UPI00164D9ACB|nr:hypothetical protein [Sporosarcina sp. resist]QNK89076.1 hypothetical protein H7992_04950 [Sporosarcina sp. resist]